MRDEEIYPALRPTAISRKERKAVKRLYKAIMRQDEADYHSPEYTAAEAEFAAAVAVYADAGNVQNNDAGDYSGYCFIRAIVSVPMLYCLYALLEVADFEGIHHAMTEAEQEQLMADMFPDYEKLKSV